MASQALMRAQEQGTALKGKIAEDHARKNGLSIHAAKDYIDAFSYSFGTEEEASLPGIYSLCILLRCDRRYTRYSLFRHSPGRLIVCSRIQFTVCSLPFTIHRSSSIEIPSFLRKLRIRVCSKRSPLKILL